MKRVVLLAATAMLLLWSGPSRSDGPKEASLSILQVRSLIVGHDLVDAGQALEKEPQGDPFANLERGRLALYEERCDEAVQILSDDATSRIEDAQELLTISKGCAQVTAMTVVKRDVNAGVEVRYQDTFDQELQPWIVESVILSREAITRELGVTWPVPTRVTVVRDLLSLSLVTGLPYDSARSTGTVAVAKWGRVTLLSPRAPHHGYGWRDTLTHELTHLAVARASLDRAPLWVQEGLAKHTETHWRPSVSFDERWRPDDVVHSALAKGQFLPFDKFGPSFGMLPNADAAMTAFSEVTSFVRFFLKQAGQPGIQRVLAGIREGKSAEDAVTETSGKPFQSWQTEWQSAMRSRESKPEAKAAAMPRVRDKLRLTELLLGRKHPESATLEFKQIAEGGRKDPRVRYVAARLEEALGRDVLGALTDPYAFELSYGPCWGLAGRFEEDGERQKAVILEGIAVDPWNVELACLSRSTLPKALCDGARTNREPPLGQD